MVSVPLPADECVERIPIRGAEMFERPLRALGIRRARGGDDAPARGLKASGVVSSGALVWRGHVAWLHFPRGIVSKSGVARPLAGPHS